MIAISLAEIPAPAAAPAVAAPAAVVWLMLVLAVRPLEDAFTRSALPLPPVVCGPSRGLSLIIGDHRERAEPLANSAPGPREGRIPLPLPLVCDFRPAPDDGFARGPLPDVVDGALAFHHHQVERGRNPARGERRERRGHPECQNQRPTMHGNPPEHGKPPSPYYGG
jgi:hypothetical protein